MQRFNRQYAVSKKGILCISWAILILVFHLPTYSENNPVLREETLEKMSLQELLIHEAKWLSQKGYIPANAFLRSQIQEPKKELKKELKQSKTFFLKKFSKKEKHYLLLLQKRISFLKGKKRKELFKQLQTSLQGEFLIQFSRLADLDGDGTLELLAIAGRNFEYYPGSLLYSPEYYQQSHEFHVFISNEKSYIHRKISQGKWGIAEYISDFASDYYLKNGKEQIKIILHSFPLEPSLNKLHEQKVYLFSLEEGEIQNIFTHLIYKNFYAGKQEKTLEYQMEFRDVKGLPTPEILLRRGQTHRVYAPGESARKNYKETRVSLPTVYFQYNVLEKIFQRIEYSKPDEAP